MSVQFDEENKFNESFQAAEKPTGGIAKWLIEKRIVKDAAGANKIMIVVAIVCFALAVYLTIK